MGYAFQWRVTTTGSIDGALNPGTDFVWPERLPVEGETIDLPSSAGTATRENGVVIFQLAPGVDLGRINLFEIPDNVTTQKGWWVPAMHLELSDGALPGLAFEIRVAGATGYDPDLPVVLYPGAQSPATFVSNQVATLWNAAYIAQNGVVELWTDQASLEFLAGPSQSLAHFYIEIEPILNDDEFAEVLVLLETATTRGLANSRILDATYPAAADFTEVRSIGLGTGLILAALEYSSNLPNPGESVDISVSASGAGGGVTIDDTTYTSLRSVAWTAASNSSHRWTVESTQGLMTTNYVAGGGPAPIAGAAIRAVWSPVWQSYRADNKLDYIDRIV